MKIRLLSIMSVAVLLLGSCVSEVLPVEGGSVRATMESDQTRTSVTDEGTFTWSAGDQVWLHTTSGSVAGTLSSGAGTASANFSYGSYFGEMTGKAVNPYNSGHSISGDVLNVVMPSSYDLGTELSSTNAAMYGENVNGNIRFNHLAGVMRFKFNNVPAGVNKFVLTLDKKINGTFAADLTEDYPVIEAEEASSDEEKTITLNFDALTEVSNISLYVPLPLGTYNSLSLALLAGDEEVWTKTGTATNTINRKSLLLMPTVNLSGSIGGDIEGGDSDDNAYIDDSQFNPEMYLRYISNAYYDGYGDAFDYNMYYYSSYIYNNAFALASKVEYKFQLASVPTSDCYLSVIEYGDGSTFNIYFNQRGLYVKNNLLSWEELGVEPTDVIVMSFEGNTMILNGRSFSFNSIRLGGYIFSGYYYDRDDGVYSKYYPFQDNAKLFYAKGWDAEGNLIYLGGPDIAEGPSGNDEACWKSTYYFNDELSTQYHFAYYTENQEYIPYGFGNLLGPEEEVPTGPANNEIWYTTKNNAAIHPSYTDVFGANISSNTYSNGKGVITFDGPVTQIGDYAFYQSANLTSITIPDNVTSIGHGAFCKCNNLEEFIGKFAEDNGRILAIDGVLAAFAPSGLSEYTIPNYITTIGYEAFRECDNLADITIPNSVTIIDGHAFQNCDNITEIIIPDSVTSIGEYAFDYCHSLSDVTLGDGVNVINHLAFYECDHLTSIIIPDSVAEIGGEAFYGCSNLKNVTIGNGVTVWGSQAFAECTSLTNVVLGAGLTSIGTSAFLNCSGLKKVYCLGTTPPNGGTKMFSYYTGTNGYYEPQYEPLDCKIYVPAQSVNDYKNSWSWSDYASMIFAMPAVENAVNLSEIGTANSYIVSQAGLYKFTPTKGNSIESVGTIASAEVLWESLGISATPFVGSLISYANYEDGIILFSTPESFKEGNAVIAAKDASGTILWSWHIWFTDEPEGQVYYNNAGTVMDRNLGATSATPGNVGALGLLYQWGRKDPFLGSSSISSSTVAKSTLTWPSSELSTSSVGTIEYAVAHPTTFITSSNTRADWLYIQDNTRWQSEKTIYDPCPVGWRVPEGGNNGIWATALGSSTATYDSTNEGINFSGKLGDAATIWYPAAGYIEPNGGTLGYVGSYGDYWSVTPSSSEAHRLDINSTGAYPKSSNLRSCAFSVRCVQDGSSSGEPDQPEEPSPSQPSYSVQFKPSTYGWVQSTTVSNPDASLYDGVYESTNQGRDNTKSIMYIDINGYDEFTIYVRSSAESTWDYVEVSNLDVDITGSTSGIKMTTSGNQQSGTSLSSYTAVTFTNIGGGQHRIMVTYKKDSSQSHNDDKGYVLIPKNQ